MTPDMNWKNIAIDYEKPSSYFDVSDDEGMREAFNWVNTQPLLKKFIFKKGENSFCLIINCSFLKLVG